MLFIVSCTVSVCHHCCGLNYGYFLQNFCHHLKRKACRSGWACNLRNFRMNVKANCSLMGCMICPG
tara:strand:- start:897 stop:1094 length:198 start_codon:yes stop_codon:yes gene_type:complete